MNTKKIKKLKVKNENNDNITRPQKIFVYKTDNIYNSQTSKRNNVNNLKSAIPKTKTIKSKNNFVNSMPNSSFKGKKYSRNDGKVKSALIISSISILGLGTGLGVMYGIWSVVKNPPIYHEAPSEVSPSYNFELPNFEKPVYSDGSTKLASFYNRVGKNNEENTGLWSGKVNSTYDLEELSLSASDSPFGLQKWIDDGTTPDVPKSNYLYGENIYTSSFNDSYGLFGDINVNLNAEATVDKYVWVKDEDLNIEVEYIENLTSIDAENEKIHHTSLVLQFIDNEEIKIKFEKIGGYKAKTNNGKIFNPKFYIWNEANKEWVEDVKVINETEYLGKVFEEKIERFEEIHNDKSIDEVIKEVFIKNEANFTYEKESKLVGLILPEFSEIENYTTYNNRTSGQSYEDSTGVWHGEFNSTYDIDKLHRFDVNEFGINWFESTFLESNQALFLRDISAPSFKFENSNIFKVNGKNIIDITNNNGVSIQNVYFLYDSETNIEIEYIKDLKTTSSEREIVFNSLKIKTSLNQENEVFFDYKEVEITNKDNSSITELHSGIYDKSGQYKKFTGYLDVFNWLSNEFVNITGITIQDEVTKIIDWANNNIFYESNYVDLVGRLPSIDPNRLAPEDKMVNYVNESNTWVDSLSNGTWQGKFLSTRDMRAWDDNPYYIETFNQNSLFGVPILSDIFMKTKASNKGSYSTVIKNARNNSYKNGKDELIEIVNDSNKREYWDDVIDNSVAKLKRYVLTKSRLNKLIENGAQNVAIQWGIEIESITNFEIETKDNGLLHLNSITIRKWTRNQGDEKIDEKFVYKQFWNDKKMETFTWTQDLVSGEDKKLNNEEAITWIDALIDEIGLRDHHSYKINSLTDLFNHSVDENRSWGSNTKTINHHEAKINKIDKPKQLNIFENSNNYVRDDSGNEIVIDGKKLKLYDHIEGKFQSTSSEDDGVDLTKHSLFGPKTIQVTADATNTTVDPKQNTMIYYEDIKIKGFNNKAFERYNHNFGYNWSSTISPSLFKMPDGIVLPDGGSTNNVISYDQDFHFSDETSLDVTIDSILQMEVQGGYLFPKKDASKNWHNSLYLTQINGFRGQNSKGEDFDIDFAFVRKSWDEVDASDDVIWQPWVYIKYGVQKNKPDLFNNIYDYVIRNIHKNSNAGGKFYLQTISKFNSYVIDRGISKVLRYDNTNNQEYDVSLNYYIDLMERSIYSSMNENSKIHWKYKDWIEDPIK